MAVAIGDILRVNANMLLDGVGDNQNIFHFQWSGVGGIDDDLAMDQVAAEMDNLYLFINAHVSTAITYVNITAQNLSQMVLLPTKAWPTLVDGDSLGQLLPPEVYGQVHFRTTRPKTRASKRLGGFTENDNTLSGSVLSTLADQLQVFGDLLVAGMPSPGARVIYGAYNRLLDRFTPVNAAVVSTEWRSLKRRRRGAGS